MKSRDRMNQQIVEWLPNSETADMVLLVAHFPSTFASLQQRLSEGTKDYRVETGSLNDTWLVNQLCPPEGGQVNKNAGSQPEIILCLSQQFEARVPDDSTNPQLNDIGRSLASCPKVAVLVAERHFLQARDTAIIEFVAASGVDRQIGFFVALDDPVVRVFGNAALFALMEHYGLKEKTAVESPLVSKQVKHAQRRFAKIAAGDSFVSSPHEWLTVHCPQIASA